MFSLTVLVFVIIIFGLIAYSDAKQISQSIESGEKTLVYVDTVPLAGIKLPAGSKVTVEDGNLIGGAQALTEEELSSIKLDNSSNLTIFVDKQWIWSVQEEYHILQANLSEEDIDHIMSGEAHPELASIGLEDNELKAVVFFSLFAQAVKASDPQQIMRGIHDETITVQPKLISTGLIKLIPEQAFSSSLRESIKIPEVNI